MAAHLRDIRFPKCAHWNCDRNATKTLYNTWNAKINSYCTRHANQALREFQQLHEQESRR